KRQFPPRTSLLYKISARFGPAVWLVKNFFDRAKKKVCFPVSGHRNGVDRLDRNDRPAEHLAAHLDRLIADDARDDAGYRLAFDINGQTAFFILACFKQFFE